MAPGNGGGRTFFTFPPLAHSLHSLKPTLEGGNVSKAIWLFSSPSPPHVTERGLAKKDGNKKNLFSKYSGNTRGKRSGCCCSSEREGRRGLRGETGRGKSIINFSLTPQVPFPLGREGQRSLNQKAEKNRKPLLFFSDSLERVRR